MGKRRIPDKAADTPIDTLHGSPVAASLDLHGLDARSAELRLEMFLGRQAPGTIVRIVTGKGNRSEGGAVLKPLVRDLLTGRLAPRVGRWTLETGGGAYLVEVSRGG